MRIISFVPRAVGIIQYFRGMKLCLCSVAFVSCDSLFRPNSSLLKLVIPLLATNCLVCSKELHLILLPNISAADPPKAEQAIRWFYPSASAGNARAQYNLGLCLQNGKGIKRNQKKL
jgi:hypothetical protein